MSKNTTFNTTATYYTKYTLQDWFSNTNPQYFLSIQFPIHLRKTDLTSSNKKLHKIMSTFEKILLGRHWNRKYIPFIAIAEHGKSVNWHYHILIYNCPVSFLKLQSIFDDVITKLNLTHETLYIEPINDTGVNSYTSKEFTADINYHFDSDRIITSEILFGIPYKST